MPVGQATMLPFLRARAARRRMLDRLYGAIVAAARAPAFYRDLGVPDSFEGRFELVTLHAVLVLRALHPRPAPAGDLAQDLVDTMFKHLDHSLREAGTGDLAVPKRMRRIAEGFYGRARAYEDALADPEALGLALGRNVLGEDVAGPAAPRLAAYPLAAAARLDRADLAAFTDGAPPFPDPEAILREPRPSPSHSGPPHP